MAIVFGLALVAGAAGCAVFVGETRKSLDIKAAGANAIKVEDRTVAVADLAAAVKSAGADKNTLITVRITADVPVATGMLIRDTLVRKGFPKVVIAQHRLPCVSVAPLHVK
ncbi:MAG: hypothetical protein QME60_07715 [Verrucomicrobiota bacterium]|nr:hypothetical protein [Verrucomicrobiota bacterium]